MNNKRFASLFLILFVFVFAISFVSASFFSNFFEKISGQASLTDVPAPEALPQPALIVCLDSDGGKNIYEKGIVNYYDYSNETWNSFTDYCSSNYTLIEGYCINNNTFFSVGVSQQGGIGSCNDGAFVTLNSSEEKESDEIDSDLYVEENFEIDLNENPQQNQNIQSLTFRQKFQNFFGVTNSMDANEEDLGSQQEVYNENNNPDEERTLLGRYNYCKETDLYPQVELKGDNPWKYGRTYFRDGQYQGSPWNLKKDYCADKDEDGVSQITPVENGNFLVEYYCVEKVSGEYPDNYNPSSGENYYFEVWQVISGCSCEGGNINARCVIYSSSSSEENNLGIKEKNSYTERLTFGQKFKNFFNGNNQKINSFDNNTEPPAWPTPLNNYSDN